ncbi:MAG: AAA family ATPase [Clostridiaceae bacterium]|nr:AAA family ATPase [Clostridiaceae bacterium]
MIVWINGAFGSGKTSVAETLNKNIAKSFIYDPEQVGYFLWDNFPDELKRKDNFQHLQIWREFNYKMLKHIYSHYDGMIIVPMTIYNKQYFDEIIGSLICDKIIVHHFILTASKQTIISRLKQRGETEDCWAAQHIEKCLKAFETEIKEQKLDTEGKSIELISSEIMKKLTPEA